MSREEVIRTAWAERGRDLWNRDTHGKGEPLWIQASVELVFQSSKVGRAPLQAPDMLEFRWESAQSSGRPHHAIVCEGVVVETIER
jgi:hypothetical protein